MSTRAIDAQMRGQRSLSGRFVLGDGDQNLESTCAVRKVAERLGDPFLPFPEEHADPQPRDGSGVVGMWRV